VSMNDLPVLEATLKLEEVHKAAGAMSRESLRGHLKRNGALVRFGNEYVVDSAALAKKLPGIHAVLVRNRMLAQEAEPVEATESESQPTSKRGQTLAGRGNAKRAHA
jgi:hypothetical protein